MNKMQEKLAEKILCYVKEKEVKPLPERAIQQALKLSAAEMEVWSETLGYLLTDGKLLRTKKDMIGVPDQMNLLVGIFSASSKGFGFVIPDGVSGDDVFISPAECGGAMNGDRVVCRIHSARSFGRKGREGEIIRILERKYKNVVGTFESAGAYGFVVPDDRKLNSDLFVPERGIGFAKHGDKVIVEITKWPERGRSAEGFIIDVLGRADDPHVAMESIIFQYGIHQNFPSAVIDEAMGVPQEVPGAAKKGRRILKDIPIVTIDGEDAKDLDDAVHVHKLEDGNYLLGVYIADVSYYVRPSSELDKESYDRGTSVYLPDRVIPMLPKELSNGICSLNAGVDRLAFCCDMVIDPKGKIKSFEIYDAVIRVSQRLNYPQVTRALVEKEEATRADLREYLPMLEEMAKLSEILKQKRMGRGAIDFDFPELKVKVDEAGKTVGIYKRERNLAESIIEEFMLAANETVAKYMSDLQKPFVYRIHENPSTEKLQEFGELIRTFGYKLPDKEEIDPIDLQRVLTQVKGQAEERMISTVMLRSLRQAVYKEENSGHFGLAAQYYTHFTSPIRRYPDLMVHRLLKNQLGIKSGSASAEEQKLEYLAKATKHASEQERNAALAEREATDLKKVEYMAQFVGEEFEGFISGVTAFGLFVELENGVEGLLRISNLTDDYYQHFEKEWKLVGQRTGKQFRLGDPLKVKLVKASPEEKQIDFIIAGEDESTFNGGAQKPFFRKKFGKPSGKASSNKPIAPKKAKEPVVEKKTSVTPIDKAASKKKKSKNPFWKTLKKKK